MDVAKNPDDTRDQEICRLVELHQTALLRMCYMYLHDKSLAEDAVQETFIKAYKALDGYRRASSEKTWLMRIAINTCRDMRRSTWFRYVDRRITPETIHRPSVQVEQADEVLTLAIMKLPPKLKEVIMLYYYQDMKITEIADALNRSISSVSGRLSRAKARLRTTLKEGCSDE